MSSKIIRADNQQHARVSRFDFGVLATASMSATVTVAALLAEALPTADEAVSTVKPTAA